MIPASYLFKDIYQQTWLDTDLEAAVERPHANDKGHPIWSSLIRALAAIRLPKLTAHHGGTFAHD